MPLKVQLFGICNDGNHKQTNYLFSESETIGPNGSKAHGPNSVISMLHHYLEMHSSHEKECHLHADNCVAQNKNRYIVGYFVWRVLTGRHHTIILSFMQVGHTRCIVDENFGLIKRLYRQSDVDALSQLGDIVRRSSCTNLVQLYSWEWREWDVWLNNFFTAVNGIRKIHHLRITADMADKIFVKSDSSSDEKENDICKV